MGKFLRNQSTHRNNGVGIIKSQKVIANTQNVKTPKGEKTTERRKREENFTIIMVITSEFL